MQRKSETIQAVTDDGSPCSIEVIQHFVEHRPIAGPASSLPGRRSYVTAEGEEVALRDDGTFYLLDTGRVARRVE